MYLNSRCTHFRAIFNSRVLNSRTTIKFDQNPLTLFHPGGRRSPLSKIIKISKSPNILTSSFYLFPIILDNFMLLGVVEMEKWAFCQGKVGISYSFPYWSENQEIANISSLDDGKAFIFTPRLSIGKTNISWHFYEHPIRWRHFMTCNVIFL